MDLTLLYVLDMIFNNSNPTEHWVFKHMAGYGIICEKYVKREVIKCHL